MCKTLSQNEPFARANFPAPELKLLKKCYQRACVILEYGSGGSTWLASSMPGKLIFSVESDRDFAIKLQTALGRSAQPSPALVRHVDIGKTGRWGRPINESSWRKYHTYPLNIWSEPFFRHPDLVLIDGRFRPACFLAVALKITRPVTVLFDDYINRPAYWVVEKIARPRAVVGRMAQFLLKPLPPSNDAGFLFAELATRVSVEADNIDYGDAP